MATVVNCCWNSDQKAALAMNIGMNATTRLRSTGVIRRLVRITAKYATAATMVSATTISERLAAVITPANENANAMAIATIAITATRGRAAAGSGFGGRRSDPVQVLAPQRVLDEAERHSDCGKREPDVEAPVLLRPSGDQRTDQATEVDAHVEDRETRIPAFVVGCVQIADEGCRVALSPPLPNAISTSPTPTPARPGMIARLMCPA